MQTAAMARHSSGRKTRPLAKRPRYQPPNTICAIPLSDALQRAGRATLADRQLDMLRAGTPDGRVLLHYAGEIGLLEMPAVSIVGTREVSMEGLQRATQLARDLAQAGVLVVSGLARGVDTAAHKGAMQFGGSTAAVIGTPLSKAYPAENSSLQEEIYAQHLLLSPFDEAAGVFKGNFPARNRVMAALSDATVIVEASDTSGTLHQAAECLRLGRWLFIMKSVVEDPTLTWPSRFVGKPYVEILSRTDDLLARIQ